MRTSMKALAAATLFGLSFAASPAMAQDETAVPGEFTFSGYVQGVSDYRYRGYSLSGGDPAIQGSVNLNHSSGFYAGAWASSLDGDRNAFYGDVELDLYAGWTGQVTPGLTADVGVLRYVYPSNSGFGPADYWEPYASLAATVGPVNAKVGVAYAWEQDSLADDDNLYLFTDVSTAIPTTPLTLTGHLGYTDGVLSPEFLSGNNDDDGFDWSVGVSYNVNKSLSVSAAYVGADGSVSESEYNRGLGAVVSNDTVVATVKLAL